MVLRDFLNLSVIMVVASEKIMAHMPQRAALN